jgi:hypothetical protein
MRILIDTVGYAVISRLAIVVSEVFAASGMGYGIHYTFDALSKRAPLRLVCFALLFLVSFSLLFLNLFGFIGQWPPVAAWLS